MKDLILAMMKYNNDRNKNKSVGKLLDLTLKFLFIDLFKRKSAPQIFVLFVDTFICAISYFFVLTFNPQTSNSNLLIDQIPSKILIVVCVYFTINLIVKNYKYTIRLPIIEDMYRTVELVLYSSLFLILMTFVVRFMTDTYFFSIWDLFVAGGMAFTLMMCLRLITKHLYSIHVDRVGNTLPVILLGNNISTIALAHMLKNELPRRYNPVAIITTDSQYHKDTTINGFKVIKYSEKDLENIFNEFDCQSVLIPDNVFNTVNKSIIDIFLKKN